ncbi:Noggin [Echinococcus granulosus]|nr:Noggin [Echinococcus granulosus]
MHGGALEAIVFTSSLDARHIGSLDQSPASQRHSEIRVTQTRQNYAPVAITINVATTFTIMSMHTGETGPGFFRFFLLLLYPLISLTVVSANFNLSNDHSSGLAALYYQRRPHSGPILTSASSSSPTSSSSSTLMSKSGETVVSGGMGLSLSNRNHISLGHLTKKEPPTSSRTSDLDVDSSPSRSMRVMGQPINPNIVSHLHPDVSPRKIHRLWRLLGGKEDKYWTSEEPPRVLRQRGVSGMLSDTGTHPPGANSVDGNLIRKANALNMTFRDQTGAQFLLPETQIQIFRNWLIEQATCEMDFIWKDLGSLYWPRWIRMGVCLARLGSSCSWPPGMKCQPSGSRVLRLLNWNCEDAAQAESADGSMLSRKTRSLHQPTINLRYHLQEPGSRRRMRQTYAQQTSPMWRYYRMGRRKGRRDASMPMDPAQQEEQRARRARRLIEKLSVTASGYRCSWQVQKYLISDKCTSFVSLLPPIPISQPNNHSINQSLGF